MNVEALGITLEQVGDTLELLSENVTGNWKVGAIRFSNDPLIYGRATDASGAPLASYGGLEGDYRISSRTGIKAGGREGQGLRIDNETTNRKSTRLNSSHVRISYAVFCLKKKNTTNKN